MPAFTRAHWLRRRSRWTALIWWLPISRPTTLLLAMLLLQGLPGDQAGARIPSGTGNSGFRAGSRESKKRRIPARVVGVIGRSRARLRGGREKAEPQAA